VSAGRRTTSKRQERSCGLRRLSQGIYLIGREPVIMKDTDQSPRLWFQSGGEATLETAIRAPSVSSSVNLQRSRQSLGGRENQPIPYKAGNDYRNHARHVGGITSLIRIEIANRPPYFLVRHFYARHIGLWIRHTILLIFGSSMPKALVGRNSLRASVR
jgi:hypothetical protein